MAKINVETIVVGPLQTNCYLVYDQNMTAVVIDPGFHDWKILNKIKQLCLEVKYIILTHGHYDHITAAPKISAALNVPIVVNELTPEFLNDPELSLLCWFDILKDTEITADITVTDNQTQTVGEMNIKYINTPGHTKDSMCLIIEDCIFSGDTLFYDGAGRCDLPTGNNAQLRKSISERLGSMEKDYKIYPGHLESTTLDYEKKHNDYFREIL